MNYVGSKRRIADDILTVMYERSVIDKNDNYYFYDLFVGGANLIQNVDNKFLKIGVDVNPYLIHLYQSLQNGFDLDYIDTNVSVELWKDVKINKVKYSDEIVAIIGILGSFKNKWFDGYGVKSNNRNYLKEGIKNLKKQTPLLSNIEFICDSYHNIQLKKNSIVYCDIPYKNSTKPYKLKTFDYNFFYQYVINLKLKGYNVYISEYEMDDRFKCIWSREISSTLGNKKSIEKLFVPI